MTAPAASTGEVGEGQAVEQRPVRLEDLPDVLTIAEVAAVFRLKKSAVYEKAAAGIIPRIPLGVETGKRQCARFSKATIARIIAGERVDCGSAGAPSSPRSRRGHRSF